MKISIITVCKNVEKSIERTILSVVEQTYNDIEYIIIDGKSTDKTLDVIKKYEDKIDVFVSENDSGIYEAMNKGIKHSSGDYLLFLNAGDYFVSQKSLAEVSLILTKNNPDFLYSNIKLFYPNSNKFVDKNYKRVDRFFLFRDTINHQASIFSKTLFSAFGFYDVSLKICSDYDFLMKFFFNKKIKKQYIEKSFIVFEIGGISTAKDNKDVVLQERTLIKKRYYSKFEFKLFSSYFYQKFRRIFF